MRSIEEEDESRVVQSAEMLYLNIGFALGKHFIISTRKYTSVRSCFLIFTDTNEKMGLLKLAWMRGSA